MTRSKWRPNADSDEASSINSPCEEARLAARDDDDPPPAATACWPCRRSCISSFVSPNCVSNTALVVFWDDMLEQANEAG